MDIRDIPHSLETSNIVQLWSTKKRRVTVRQLPPRESLRSRVSFESRKGTKAEPEARALIQLPKANKDPGWWYTYPSEKY